jgi:hypothetical protein
MIPRKREVPPALPLTELVGVVAPALALDGTIQAPVGARVFAAAALAERSPVLAVTATAREAEDLVDELGDIVGSDQVALYPAWETLPHERLSPRSDTVGRRLAVLRRLVHADPTPVRVVVAPVRSILQPQVRGLADLAPVDVAVGHEFGLDRLVQALADAAYVRVDLVERRGEFAVRGGIVDVFPPTEVPVLEPYALMPTVERTDVPVATISGFINPALVGPFDEPTLMTLLLSVLPTVRTLFELWSSEKTVPKPGGYGLHVSMPELPAANTCCR